MTRPAFFLLTAAFMAVSAACTAPRPATEAQPLASTGPRWPEGGLSSEETDLARRRMIETQIMSRGVKDARVLEALERVPRHDFVPPSLRQQAYTDRPLPIGLDQTISQPYIVALMSELAGVKPGSRVLEIGTGSGYQAAVLAEMGAEVYSVEILEPLARQAAGILERLGYRNVHVRHGDGYLGWPEAAPFDAVLITAAPPRVPEPLKEQLKTGGKLIAPVGVGEQELIVITRTGEKTFDTRPVIPVRFVPMTGKAQE